MKTTNSHTHTQGPEIACMHRCGRRLKLRHHSTFFITSLTPDKYRNTVWVRAPPLSHTFSQKLWGGSRHSVEHVYSSNSISCQPKKHILSLICEQTALSHTKQLHTTSRTQSWSEGIRCDLLLVRVCLCGYRARWWLDLDEGKRKRELVKRTESTKGKHTERRPGQEEWSERRGGWEVSVSSAGRRGQRESRFVRDRQGPRRRQTEEGRETHTQSVGRDTWRHTHTQYDSAYINVYESMFHLFFSCILDMGDYQGISVSHDVRCHF